ncbi:MAG: hypothetical protein NC124_16755 [Clostridium sp.]|nr:hypothetical protein [Clostridium sp.]
MGLFKNTGKETIILLQKENKRLKEERNRLLAKLNEIDQYKEDYGKLIDETKIIKERYESLAVKTEGIFEEYKGKLSEIISTGE